MNRKEKRQLAHKLHVRPRLLDGLLKLARLDAIEAKVVEAGQKIKIDFDKIMQSKKALSKKYFEFVKAHRGEIFTVEGTVKNYKHIVTLAEDPSDPKWMFHTDSLIVVEEAQDENCNV